MRVLVHMKAADHRYLTAVHNKRPLPDPKWLEMLRQVEGQWLEVEMEHLFRDQFNTAPILGVSENGLRLMIEDVAAIEDDVRDGVVKCRWCGGYDHNKDDRCDKCGKDDNLEPLNPIRPVVPNSTTKALGIKS